MNCWAATAAANDVDTSAAPRVTKRIPFRVFMGQNYHEIARGDKDLGSPGAEARTYFWPLRIPRWTLATVCMYPPAPAKRSAAAAVMCSRA